MNDRGGGISLCSPCGQACYPAHDENTLLFIPGNTRPSGGNTNKPNNKHTIFERKEEVSDNRRGGKMKIVRITRNFR